MGDRSRSVDQCVMLRAHRSDMVALLATDARRSYSLPVNTQGGT